MTTPLVAARSAKEDAEMSNVLAAVLRWFSASPNGADGRGEGRGLPADDYDRRVRELEERAGRLFLP